MVLWKPFTTMQWYSNSRPIKYRFPKRTLFRFITKGEPLGHPYRADFLCNQSIIVELKAIKALTDIESAQIIHYLKATGFQRGLLINFGTPKLQYKRFIHSSPHLRSSA
jgi:GxxExxY protein